MSQATGGRSFSTGHLPARGLDRLAVRHDGPVVDLWVRRPGADLACWVRGDGPVVGYAHGMMLSRAAEEARGLHDWAPVTGRRRMVRYDARAHGRSSGRAVVKDYTWPRLADDLIAVATAATATASAGRHAPVDFMGASMGCGTLLWAAVKAPERFRRLVLIIPPTAGVTRAAAARLYLAEAAAGPSGGAPSAPPPIFAGLDSYPQRVSVGDGLLASVLRGAAASDLPDRDLLARIAHPALILAWETDPVHPVSTARLLHETLPDAKLQVAATEEEVRRWPDEIAEYLNP